MAGNLWIGGPGKLREITDRADFDRSPTIAVTEHRSVEGQVTVWTPKYTPRRLKLAWKSLRRDDAAHLNALARGLPTPAPIAVLDPATDNLFESLQALADNIAAPPEFARRWSVSTPGTGVAFIRPLVLNGIVGTVVTWKHSAWVGWPVAPDMRFTFSLEPPIPPATPAGQLPLTNGLIRLEWLDAYGGLLSSSAGPAPGRTVGGVAPAKAVFVRPSLVLGVAMPANSYYAIPPASLTLGSLPAVAGVMGDGCPAYAVTTYTESVSLPYRDVSIELVEVASAT